MNNSDNHISYIQYVDLVKIVKMTDSEIPVEVEFPVEAFSDNSLNFSSPVRLLGKIINLSGMIRIEAILNFSVEHSCDRCLTSFTNHYEIPLSDEIALVNSEREIDEYIPYSNNRVDLSEAIYKCIFSEMGIKNICKPDCKGLCGKCGADLNNGICNCSDEDIDPRLLKLKELLK